MTRPPLILICDHRGGGLAELEGRLRSAGFRTVLTQHLRRTCELFENDPPALCVIDPLTEGGRVELELIDRLRRRNGLVPLLVFAEREHPQAALGVVEALTGGAWDLIYRDAPLEELSLRIDGLFRQARSHDELQEMRYRAMHDDRTELLRPAAFEARLDEHYSAAERHHFELALLLIDLDDFGQVNKAFDHTVGDRLIAQVGEVVRSALRAEDVAGRLGGDEFGVLLPYTKKTEAARVVVRLRDEILRLSGPVPGDERELGISASIGFETFDGSDLDSVDQLRRHAEMAMREAKHAGGNRGVYYRSLVSGE